MRTHFLRAKPPVPHARIGRLSVQEGISASCCREAGSLVRRNSCNGCSTHLYRAIENNVQAMSRATQLAVKCSTKKPFTPPSCGLSKLAKLIRCRWELRNTRKELLQVNDPVKPAVGGEISCNHAYYRLLFSPEERPLVVVTALNGRQMLPYCYLCPVLMDLNHVLLQRTPVAQNVSPRMLYLPVLHGLAAATVQQLAAIVINCP